MAEKEYVLGNRAKELYRYTKQVTQPVPDDKVAAKDVAQVMRTIAQANTVEEMRMTLLTTAERLDSKRDRYRFPKSESFGMIADLRNTARTAMRHILAANEVNFRERPEERLKEIKAAIDDCNLLLQLIDLSHDLQYIDTKRMGTWTKKVTDVKYMSLAWLRKDGARAASLLKDRDQQHMESLVRLVREIIAKEGAARNSDTPPQ
jgi:hypothetical protein